MTFNMTAFSARRVVAGVCIAVGLAVSASPALAEGPQCQKRYLAQNIKDAVLALKATEYCVGQTMPYSQAQVYARIEALKCGPEAELLLSDMINRYDAQYRLIMTQDSSGVVCDRAAQLSFN